MYHSYGEFLWWIGVWLLMSMLHGPDCATFWSLMHVDCFRGVPWRLNDLMSQKQFDTILRTIFYTNHDKPTYRDKFWEGETDGGRVEQEYGATIHSIMDLMSGREHEPMDKQVYMPRMDVCA